MQNVILKMCAYFWRLDQRSNSDGFETDFVADAAQHRDLGVVRRARSQDYFLGCGIVASFHAAVALFHHWVLRERTLAKMLSSYRWMNELLCRKVREHAKRAATIQAEVEALDRKSQGRRRRRGEIGSRAASCASLAAWVCFKRTVRTSD
jgi:hypothetical protein